jgi:hypothetical protein
VTYRTAEVALLDHVIAQVSDLRLLFVANITLALFTVLTVYA